jgi:Arc/MetJ-type ribon-helix-helix transcriptional regulator
MNRTQIYLDERQRKALKLIAATTDVSMSDLIRRAVDRLLLSDEFAGKDWASEMRIAVESIRESVPQLSDEALDELGSKRRRIAAEKAPARRVRNRHSVVETDEKHKVHT